MNPNVTIVVPFRDNVAEAMRMYNQVYELNYPGDNLRMVCVEGDSIDDTPDILRRISEGEGWADWMDKFTFIKFDLDVPKFPSQINPIRFKALAQTFNRGLDEAMVDDWTDFVFLGPSDLFFESDLIKRLVNHDLSHVAPMYWIKLGPHTVFYDTWGFRDLTGRNWTNFSWKWGEDNLPAQPFEMMFAGGAAMFRRDVLEKGCRYTEKEVDNGMCKSIREKGFKVMADPTTHVFHRARNG